MSSINRNVFPDDPMCYARGDTRKRFRRRILHELARDFDVIHDGDIDTVPEGFHSDGASIPQVAYSVAGGPYSDTYVYAAFWHDFMYNVHARDWQAKLGHLRHHPRSWEIAEMQRSRPKTKAAVDRIFYELLLECGQPKYRALYFYAAVRCNLLAKWRSDV